MKKQFKRLLTLVLAVCMVMTSFTAAFAVNDDETADEAASDSSSNVTVTREEDLGLDLKKDLKDDLKIKTDTYAPSEVVRVIVVFQQQSLVDRGFSAIDLENGTAAVLKAQQDIEKQQDDILARIEAAVEEAMAGIPMPADAEAGMEVNYRYDAIFNGASINIPFGALKAVQGVRGVKSAFVAKQYSLPVDVTDTAQPLTYNTSTTDGAVRSWDAGYDGEGMRVAIIDTGLDIDHPSFSSEGFTTASGALDEAGIAEVLDNLHVKKEYQKNITAKDLYVNKKVPYAFCYVDGDTDVSHADGQGDHGTHVAGIVAANKIDGVDVVGVAPKAQLLIMKVFGDNGGAYQDDIAAALEDALYLGADAVNMSLGSDAGFGTSGDEWEDAIYASVAESGVVLAVAAGNSTSSAVGNMNGMDKNRTSDPDNSIISSPATYQGVTAVASVENDKMMLSYFELGDEKITYSDSGAIPFTTLAEGEESDEKELQYIVIPGVGEETDFKARADAIDSMVEDPWIALIQRGQIDFTLKQTNAYNAGASACIVYDNVDDVLSNMMDAGLIPNVFITEADGQKLVDAAKDNVGTITVYSKGETAVPNTSAGKMSDFSSWGPSPNLTLTPDITAPGGHIYSTLDEGKYGDMSGTSMATPHIAGMAALVLQYLEKEHPELTGLERHNVAEALLMSTATPVMEKNKLPYSPRLQGAGLANVYHAVTSPAYITVDEEGTEETAPKASLGESSDGTYSFTFTVHNFGKEDLTYGLSATLLTDQYITGDDGEKYMGESGRKLNGTVTFTVNGEEVNEIKVPVGETVDVDASVSLSDSDKKYMSSNYENGIYVDGFVTLTHSESNEGAVDLGMPFSGFYGDWSQAPILDTGWWYEDEAESVFEKYPHVFFTEQYLLGLNPYTDTPYMEEHNILSPNGDFFADVIDDIYISLLRSAKELSFVWYDNENCTGQPLHEAVAENASKSHMNAAYGQVIPFVFS